MPIPHWVKRLTKPREKPLLVGEITETHDKLTDLMVRLKDFDERLQRYSDTHPTQEEQGHAP